MEIETEKLFKNLCQLMDSTPWRKSPYKGIMKKVADRKETTSQAIYNAAKRDRNIAVMTELKKEIVAIGDSLKGGGNVRANA